MTLFSKSSDRNVLFFSTEKKSKIHSQQYSINDINILESLNYNVVHVNSFFSKSFFTSKFYYSWWAVGSIIPLLYSFILNKKLITVVGGNEVTNYFDSISNKPIGYTNYNFFKKICVYFVLKYSSEVIVVSKYLERCCMNIFSRNYHVVYNCIDPNKYSNFNYEIRKDFLFIANFNSIAYNLKRTSNLLQAFNFYLQDYPNTQLHVCGQAGEMSESFNNLIFEIGIVDNVIFHGLIDNNRMPELFNNSKVYLQPSDTETFGLSILEALSCGCQVVCSDVGAVGELFSDYVIFCNQNSVFSIYNSMLDCHTNNVSSNLNLSEFELESRKNNLKFILSNLGVL